MVFGGTNWTWKYKRFRNCQIVFWYNATLALVFKERSALPVLINNPSIKSNPETCEWNKYSFEHFYSSSLARVSGAEDRLLSVYLSYPRSAEPVEVLVYSMQCESHQISYIWRWTPAPGTGGRGAYRGYYPFGLKKKTCDRRERSPLEFGEINSNELIQIYPGGPRIENRSRISIQQWRPTDVTAGLA